MLTLGRLFLTAVVLLLRLRLVRMVLRRLLRLLHLGEVSRGVCEVVDGELVSLVETHGIGHLMFDDADLSELPGYPEALLAEMGGTSFRDFVGWFEGLCAAADVDELCYAAEGVAVDIGAYRDAPDGLRVWCGATVEAEDVRLLMDWIAYGYGKFNA